MIKFNFLILFLASSFVFISCKKLGCTNENSVSFDEDAEKDDGSCVFESELKIYFNQAQSSAFIANSVNELKYYLNGDLIGVVPATDYSTSTPNCNSNNSFSKTISIGKIESKSFSLIIRDSSENFISNKSLNLKGNTCTVHQLN